MLLWRSLPILSAEPNVAESTVRSSSRSARSRRVPALVTVGLDDERRRKNLDCHMGLRPIRDAGVKRNLIVCNAFPTSGAFAVNIADGRRRSIAATCASAEKRRARPIPRRQEGIRYWVLELRRE